MEREEKDRNGMDGWKRWGWSMDWTALSQLSLTPSLEKRALGYWKVDG